MEAFSDSVYIYTAGSADIDAIMTFIGNEWKPGHILARDRDFFEYEHLSGRDVNFAVAADSKNEITGVLGFLPYAITPDGKRDVATVIWKVSDKCKTPALGLRLLDHVLKLEWVRTVFSIGINKKTIGIYNYLGMFTGTMDHYVILNSTIRHDEFSIAKISEKKLVPTLIPSDSRYVFSQNTSETEIAVFPFREFSNSVPYKDFAYFTKRYLRHPVYKYDICSIRREGEIVGLMVMRAQQYEKSVVLRMVDYFGDMEYLSFAGYFLRGLVDTHGFEYLDFYCFGYAEQVLAAAGFTKLNANDETLIIPNYFAPFVQKNVAINFFVNTQDPTLIRICKADGDQDRPN